ncbi:hypothetical protein F1C58_16255 (plasmid) [Glaciihabitans sp. INWT7]|uniref:hypothetical protein n=1 Tax=Glaciihabitans sp. INWT7 TaxID=2596912 RepID=UPI0016284D38|nr:hypothetical protein [Glaciihabitans sp. INWT7]QNE48612.1 hypothetical protein F1C58_16255 [Glaciihabitans sp. INWT7]
MSRRLIGLALAAAAAILLTGCALAPPTVRTPDPSLAALSDEIAAIDGVQDAVATTSYDGSPATKRIIARIYLDEPATADVPSVAQATLLHLWQFDGFAPSGYTVEMWSGPKQSPPYDNTKRVDLTETLPLLQIPGARAFKGDLYLSASDLEAKFEPVSR